MSVVNCVLFDCDGTLVDSEILCCEAYVTLFARYQIDLPLSYCLHHFKGQPLYDIFDQIRLNYALHESTEKLEQLYRQEVARLFELRLQPIEGVKNLLERITVPIAVVSNGPVSKMEHSLGMTGLLPFFANRLYSGFDLQRWKPDPTLLHHAAQEMGIPVTQCLLVEDSLAGAQAGISAGIPVFFYCADQQHPVPNHPLVTPFYRMSELEGLWQARGWQLTQRLPIN